MWMDKKEPSMVDSNLAKEGLHDLRSEMENIEREAEQGTGQVGVGNNLDLSQWKGEGIWELGACGLC